MERRRWVTLAGVVGTLASLALLLAACGGGGNGGEPTPTATPAGPATVDVKAYDPDFAFTVEPGTVATDNVTFNFANVGDIPHNMRVIRTDLAVDSLPLTEDGGQVDEAQLEVLASTEDIDPGDSVEVPLTDLPPGNYVLICNVVGHYTAGSRVAFAIEE